MTLYSKKKIFALFTISCFAAVSFGSEVISQQKHKIATITLSSFEKANRDIENSLYATGNNGVIPAINLVFNWLFMLPNFDCVDKNRPVTAALLTSDYENELPDRVAVIPLDKELGSYKLRSSLNGAYRKITGKKILYCCDAVDSNRFENIFILITEQNAILANNAKSLQWIMQMAKSRTLPSATLHHDYSIAISLNANLSGNLLKSLLPDGHDIPSPFSYLARLRDILETLISLDISVSPGTRELKCVAELKYPPLSLNDLRQIKSLNTENYKQLSHYDYSPSVSYFPLISQLLPETFLKRYGHDNVLSPFYPLRIIPGIPAADKKILPFITGERISTFVIDPVDKICGKIEIYPTDSASKVTDFISALFSEKINNITFHTQSKYFNTAIYSYSITLEPNRNEFTPTAIQNIFSLNTIELAVVNNKLIVASGKILRYFLDNMNNAKNSLLDDTNHFPPLSVDEKLIGIGRLDYSSIAKQAVPLNDALQVIERQLPQEGKGIKWRLSLKENNIVFDMSVATDEVIALMMLNNIDTKELWQYIIHSTFN